MAEEISRGARARRSRHLPEELQEEILVQLPVKSLIRFESVCKTWQSMFHSSPFIESYVIIRGRQLVFYTPPELRKMVPGMRKVIACLPFNNDPTVCVRRVERLLGPLSNGVYCLTSHIREEYGDYLSIFRGNIAVCDTSTRQLKPCYRLPVEIAARISPKLHRSNPCRANFGFGKLNSSSSDWDYKVVVLLSHGKSLSSFIGLVYNVQNDEWKIILEYEHVKTMVGDRKATDAFTIQGRRIIEICDSFELRPQRFLEGCWHWIAIGEDRSFNVLSFNFADEGFNLMGAPAFYVTDESYIVKPAVSVLHDRLVVMYLSYSAAPSHCVEVDVWMMTEYGVEKSWTKMYKIDPDSYGKFEIHLGVECRTVRDEESGGVHIKSLSFSDCDKQRIDLLYRPAVRDKESCGVSIETLSFADLYRNPRLLQSI